MQKNKENFQKMNCDDCQCNICQGDCSNCCRCYRAEYAEEDWDDYYHKGIGGDNCEELYYEEIESGCVACPWGNGEGGCTIPHCQYSEEDYEADKDNELNFQKGV